MIGIKPMTVVLMPPVGVVPLMLAVVVAPLLQPVPDLWMALEVRFHRLVLHAPIAIVNHLRIRRDFLRVLGMAGKKLLKALASHIIGEPRIVGWIAGGIRGHIRVLCESGYDDREREYRA
jgi:hypothetical protein